MSMTVKEKTTATMTASLQDADGNAIAASQLTELTLTLTEPGSNTIINSRDEQNVLNVNNVTVSEVGVVTWTLQVEDTTPVTEGRKREPRRAVFKFTWDSGNKTHWHAVDFSIETDPRI